MNALAEQHITTTGGRAATTRAIPPKLALGVGMPKVPAPEGWNWIPLTDLARLESGHTPTRKHPEYWGGDIPWISIQDAKANHGGTINETAETINALGVENSSTRLLPAGTVCLSRTASVGYVVVMGKPMATSQDFVNWVCTKRLLPHFLKYLFIAEGDDLLRFSSGAVHPTIYFPEAKAFHVCIPSVAEQRRIVGILDEAFEGIAAARACAESCLRLVQDILTATFVTVVNSFDKTSWKTASVADIASPEPGAIRTGPFGSQLLHSEFVDDGVAVLGIDNAVGNEFAWVERRYITEEKFAELKRYLVKPGDVIITIMGTCGRCAIIPDNIPRAINSKHLCCITLNRRECLPEYLHSYFLLHPKARDYLDERAKGSIMAGLNMGIIRDLPVHLPPLHEQRAIIKAVADARSAKARLLDIYARKLAAFDELKKSLLHKAFAGEL